MITKEQFIQHVVIDEHGCWIWQKNPGKDPYGGIKVDWVQYKAHVLAYLLWEGHIGIRQEVMHTCDVPKCCNPEHLRLGTHLDNMQDMATKGRSARGSRNGQAKLDEKDIPVIFAMRNSGLLLREIAYVFNVSESRISMILNRKVWRHVPVIKGRGGS